MSKVTMTFSLPDERGEFYCSLNGGAAFATLWDIDQELRKFLKYGNPPEGANVADTALWEAKQEGLQQARDILHAALGSNEINLDGGN